MKSDDINLIEQSGLFDSEWYLQEYPDVVILEMEPIAHYLQYGAILERRPACFMDTNQYMEANLDIKGQNPFLHYIKNGIAENRSLGNKGDYVQLVLSRKSSLKVGIVLHAYNLNDLEYVLNTLKSIKDQFSLYLVISRSLSEELKTIDLTTLNIRYFKEESEAFTINLWMEVLTEMERDGIEIFCKIHTNIQYNHPINSQWNKELLDYCIATPELYYGIINAFEEDPDLSIVGPDIDYIIFRNAINDDFDFISYFLNVLGFSKENGNKNYGYFAHAMYWMRLSNLNILKQLIEKNEHLLLMNNKNTEIESAFNCFLGILPAIQRKRIAIVHRKDLQDNEYILEKLIFPFGKQTNNYYNMFQQFILEDNIRLLKNFSWFPQNELMDKYPILKKMGINPHLYALNWEHETVNKKLGQINELILNQTDWHEYLIPQFIYLILYGTLKSYRKLNKEEEYYVTQFLMACHSAHLINWEQQRNKKRTAKLVSIVIPVYGQPELTCECLTSLMNTEAGIHFEVIIVNNGQEKEHIEQLKKWIERYPNIKLVQNEINLNFALGCNIGFTYCLGEKIVFLNNDTTITRNWLVKLVSALDDDNVGAVQPQIRFPDGNLQCMGITFSHKSQIGYSIYQNKPINKNTMGKDRFFQAVTGACLAIRAEDFTLLKGFDIGFVNGQEDIDLCLRLNQIKNVRCKYISESIIYHYEGKTPGRGKFVAQNREKFLALWNGKINSDDHYYYAQDGYKVVRWKVDSSDFEKLGIQTYLPSIVEHKTENVLTDYSIINNQYKVEGKRIWNKDSKNILICAHYVGREMFGGERSFLDILEASAETNYNIIVTLPNENSEYIELISNYCNWIYIFPYLFWSHANNQEDLIFLFSTLMKKLHIDLVYVNTIMIREPLLAAKKMNVKRVIHVRELIDRDVYLQNSIGLMSKQIINEVMSSSDLLVANSLETKKMFPLSNVHVIYNMINEEHFDIPNTILNNTIRIGLISSNIPKKGIFDFIEVAKLCRHYCNVQFVLIGPLNSYVEEIRTRIEEECIANITIAGYINSPVEAVKLVNIVLSLSHFAESFGRTVAEAMAARRPVIGYAWGAIPELIESGVTGFLAPFKNIDEIADSIKFLCNHPEMISSMGESARNKIISLSAKNRYVSSMKRMYQDALNENRPLINPEGKRRKIKIIIPVFNAYNEVRSCIDSVLNTIADTETEVLVINDASTDKRISLMLKNYACLPVIKLVNNETNLGYTKTVNKGIFLAGDDDVILLNSDTIVTEGWLKGLQDTAYENSSIGTVTAMSDNAGAFSFPVQGKANPKPSCLSHSNYAAILLTHTKKCLPVEVPTGSGFCLYIKRELINSIGFFDEELFPRGYGEENDFCMRALEAGWKNLISPNCFIYHIRTASFGAEKEKLVKEGVTRVIARYPTYSSDVRDAFAAEAMIKLRKAAQDGVDSIKKELTCNSPFPAYI